MRKLKFSVGDIVAPTKRAPKNLIKNFTSPKKVRTATQDFIYGRNRVLYIVGGDNGNEFLAEELKLVERAK